MIECPLRVLMVAAECRGLAQVGGLGDVVRDLSKALKGMHVQVNIVMPCYDRVKHSKEPVATFPVRFGTRDDWQVQVFKRVLGGVAVYLLRNDYFFGGAYGEVYIDSNRLGRGPFEDDAKRFAFFSAAVMEFLAIHAHLEGPINVLHCHDWHTGGLLVLLKRDARFRPIAARLRTLFTIHNLDYQGTRPFELAGENKFLSFSEWFPVLYSHLKTQGELSNLTDPHASVPCFNPMRAGINLADVVNTVSPRYATEITRPDDPARHFVGGRGLEGDLQRIGSRLYGILNGLDYELHDSSQLTPPFDASRPDWPPARKQHKTHLMSGLKEFLWEMASRLGTDFKNRDLILKKMTSFRVDAWMDKPLVVGVTRAARQKVGVLLERLDNGESVLHEILKQDLALFILGTGELEDGLEEINHFPNGLFICAFDPSLAQRLYAAGDIFLMPSDFEPCGISQMIAMRNGCLPLVHGVGGLSDTVKDMRTGWVYDGVDRQGARRALLETLARALKCYRADQVKWTEMQSEAMSERFEWAASARKYVELYRG